MNPSQLELDRNITTLRINSSELSKMSNQELIVLLNKTIENIQGIAYYWATLSAEKKGILQKHKEGEEWLGGPFVSILTLQYYIDYLEKNDQLDINKFDDSKNSYKVFPNKFIEKLTFPLLNAEIRFSKSMNFEQINEYRGFKQRIGTDSGSVTLILGAGNVSSIPFLDTIFHLVANRSSIILKLNPVNDYLNPVFQKVFHEFIERGFISVVNGDIPTSKYLTEQKINIDQKLEIDKDLQRGDLKIKSGSIEVANILSNKTKFVQSTNINEDLEDLKNNIESNTNQNQENNNKTLKNNDVSDTSKK